MLTDIIDLIVSFRRTRRVFFVLLNGLMLLAGGLQSSEGLQSLALVNAVWGLMETVDAVARRKRT